MIAVDCISADFTLDALVFVGEVSPAAAAAAASFYSVVVVVVVVVLVIAAVIPTRVGTLSLIR